MDQMDLESRAASRKVHVHEPFAQFLLAKDTIHSFDISLLDCYRFAGHACHAITGAYLSTEAAIKALYPKDEVCQRGDIKVEFGTSLNEAATGPRSNVISYITGAWAESGFPGLGGRDFKRKNLMSYGVSDVHPGTLRFTRVSTGESVVVEYNPSTVTRSLEEPLPFPESWRQELCVILDQPENVIRVAKKEAAAHA